MVGDANRKVGWGASYQGSWPRPLSPWSSWIGTESAYVVIDMFAVGVKVDGSSRQVLTTNPNYVALSPLVVPRA